MDLGTATAARDRCKKELQEVETEIRRCEGEIQRFDAKETVSASDVATHETARRKLARLRDRDLPESTAALASAESSLATAQHERDLHSLEDVRKDVASRRAKLDAKIAPLADDPHSVGEVAWAAVHDDRFVTELRAEIVALQARLAKWSAPATLDPAACSVDAGVWASFDASAAGFFLFDAICCLVTGVRAARREEAERAEREREETARAAKAQAEADREAYAEWMRAPRIREQSGAARFVFLPEQVAWAKKHDRDLCAQAKALAEEARADVPRFVATRTPEPIALVAAFFPDLADQIEAARLRNAGGGSPVVRHPAHERDALDLGTRIEVHHHPELLED